MLFKDMDRIIFTGDSVTSAGKLFPPGEGGGDRLGFGYVRNIDTLLSIFYPELHVCIKNSGIGAETSRDLLKRWDRDVLEQHPDYVSICIGINDVWRQFHYPSMPDIAPTPEEYRCNVEKMVKSLYGKVKKTFLLSPYYMEPDTQDAMRVRMDIYHEIVKELAACYGCEFVDLQAMFDRYFIYHHPAFVADDRVHPGQIGSMLIADAFLKHCGFDYGHIPETAKQLLYSK